MHMASETESRGREQGAVDMVDKIIGARAATEKIKIISQNLADVQSLCTRPRKRNRGGENRRRLIWQTK